MTVETLSHARSPRLLRPLKRAPTMGPVAPSSHSPPWYSGLHCPISTRSVTSSQTRAAGAAMYMSASTVGRSLMRIVFFSLLLAKRRVRGLPRHQYGGVPQTALLRQDRLCGHHHTL